MNTGHKMVFYMKLKGGVMKFTAFCKNSFVEHLILEKARDCKAISEDSEISRLIKGVIDGTINPSLIPVHLKGTKFQKKVWMETKNIPYGETLTYSELARRVKCRSPRAVGQALGKNPLPVIIPCHRVIGKNNKLTGFSCGLDIKRLLLDHEGVNIHEDCNSLRHP